jgi:hypothetical protein
MIDTQRPRLHRVFVIQISSIGQFLITPGIDRITLQSGLPVLPAYRHYNTWYIFMAFPERVLTHL